MCVCTQTEGMDGWVRISARTHSRGGGVPGTGPPMRGSSRAGSKRAHATDRERA